MPLHGQAIRRTQSCKNSWAATVIWDAVARDFMVHAHVAQRAVRKLGGGGGGEGGARAHASMRHGV